MITVLPTDLTCPACKSDDCIPAYHADASNWCNDCGASWGGQNPPRVPPPPSLRTWFHLESDSFFTSILDQPQCDEVSASDIPAGTRLPAGPGFSTVLPDIDFETYSEAGYHWASSINKWVSIVNSPPHGIGAVGAPVYSEHPSTEVLSLAYNLKDGRGKQIWVPGAFPPEDLFEYIRGGGLLEAHNSAFEWYIWTNVCVPRMGWPPLPFTQLRDSAAKCREFALPGALGKAAGILRVTDQKIGDGERLIKKFSMPRNPTKKDLRRRIRPEEDQADAVNLYKYNLGDIQAESAVSATLPDLSPEELELWLTDQGINFRGVHIDAEALSNCSAIIEQASERYTAELVALTDGAVKTANELKKLLAWLRANGAPMLSLDAEAVEAALKLDLPPGPKRALEIRSILGSASVKKLHAIRRRVSRDGRLRDLFSFCGALHTRRFAGKGPQPQNLPSSGPAVKRCNCGRHFGAHLDACPWCGLVGGVATEWSIRAVEDALLVIAYRNLDYVERVFGDAVAVVAGCLRGLFSAAPGKDLICSDYSAIEAVVLACLAGEQWRIDVFKTHGKIYEMSAAKITGVPFEEFMRHKGYTDITSPGWWKVKTKGDHHPMRKKVGKIAELASGFQGGPGAWCAFGADKHLSEQEIRDAIQAWRRESPNIVKFWYGMEDAAVAAVRNPGQCYEYKGITFGMKEDVLYCRLLSGGTLTYHEPRLTPGVTPWGKSIIKLSYMGWNSDYSKGPVGWMRIDTYGGKLTENVVQATARDILTYALVNAEKAGYPVVLHVHDEIVAEVPEGWGSVEEFEGIMAALPAWCAGWWPIRAAGGWRGKRYRKD